MDPITASIAGGTAATITDRVIEKMFSGGDDHEEWQQALIDLAVRAETSYEYYYENTNGTQLDKLSSELNLCGKQAQQLAVLGSRRNYDSDQIELAQELADACSSYAHGPRLNSGEMERELSENFDEIIPKLFDLAEP